MQVWVVPAKPSYSLFVAGDSRLGDGVQSLLDGVLDVLAKGPPPAVELRAWIAESVRMGAVPIERLRELLSSEEIPGWPRARGAISDCKPRRTRC